MLSISYIIMYMKTYYTSSKYANYVHIHMYVFYDYFINEVKQLGLDYSGSYSINVDIDGNIALWRFLINDPQINDVLSASINNISYINQKNIQKAIRAVAKKMNKKFEILNPELLLAEIRDVKLLTKKPNIKDNDDLSSPAVRFF